MKIAAILEYTANDGTVFQDEDKCLEHEEKVETVAKIMEPLGYRPDECDFSNGNNWLQHKSRDVELVKVALLKYIRKFVQHKWIDQTIEESVKCDPSWVGRLLSDVNDTVFEGAWYGFMCIDRKTGREYGQPYFAMHPFEVKGKAIKPIKKGATRA